MSCNGSEKISKNPGPFTEGLFEEHGSAMTEKTHTLGQPDAAQGPGAAGDGRTGNGIQENGVGDGALSAGRISLRSRILVLLIALVTANIVGALATIWHNQRALTLFNSTIGQDIASLEAAGSLHSELLMQRGFLTYYFLNGDPQWLRELEAHRHEFERLLETARESSGDQQAGARLHWQVRDGFSVIYGLCAEYKKRVQARISETQENYLQQSRVMSNLAWSTLPGAFLLGLVLLYVLMKQVLIPIRRLVVGSGPEGNRPVPGDEIEALTRRFKILLDDVNQAHTKLERSQEFLIRSEKMAMVGKMAAGVAHSIRNPLTSLKMRLFSLERSLKLDALQKEDFEVISEEIGRIDAILHNFLEYSRPPRLVVQRMSPSDIVDMALELMRHRLDSGSVEVVLQREARLPEVNVDPAQLKEALVNLLINACDAMSAGGTVTLSEEQGYADGIGPMVVIRIRDTGPGIPSALQEDIFQPFVSTREEGSGLGLPICRRILEDHGGWLSLKSVEGRGACFSLSLPRKEPAQWR